MPSNREKDKQRKVTGIKMITVFREGELIILRDLHLWTMIKRNILVQHEPFTTILKNQYHP